MTDNNSTTNNSNTPSARSAGEICNLAASLGALCDDALDNPQQVTSAQLVAMKALAGNIGALADHIGGGGYRTDALEWMGVNPNA
ncbi:MAG: hypothetical protein ACJAYC_001166 [Halieaceae bacterium]|jgi:hypothetical protein